MYEVRGYELGHANKYYIIASINYLSYLHENNAD